MPPAAELFAPEPVVLLLLTVTTQQLRHLSEFFCSTAILRYETSIHTLLSCENKARDLRSVSRVLPSCIYVRTAAVSKVLRMEFLRLPF